MVLGSEVCIVVTYISLADLHESLSPIFNMRARQPKQRRMTFENGNSWLCFRTVGHGPSDNQPFPQFSSVSSISNLLFFGRNAVITTESNQPHQYQYHLLVRTMKIFAKRTKVASPATSESKLFQSDKIVEELLKDDPSTWNAKQRRMIKRYQERVDEDAPDESTEDPKQDDEPSKELEDEESDDESEQEESAQDLKQEEEEDEAAGTDDDESSSDEAEEAEEGNMPQNDSEEDKTGEVEAEVEPKTGVPTEDPKAPEEKKASTDEPANEELEKVLEKLNSKERRKLMRQLERGGNQEEVLEEARGKLQEKEPEVDEETKKRDAEGSLSRSSKRRKKNAVDWSKLPAEERMRREDQKRLQEEAVARRESGEKAAPHKHALNSERRRANRRKPKWAARVNRNAGNEHDTSGFHMRRDQKTSTAVAN